MNSRDIWMNWERAERMVQWINTLRIPEGMNVGQPFVPRDWQEHIIRDVYAPTWPNGLRVVRKAIFSVGKKNGKTPFIAGLSSGHLCGPEAKKNEQLYSAAFEKDQASITYRYLRQMVEMDEELSSELIVRAAIKEIECPRNGSVFKALSSERKGKHGLGPALLIFDELAQFGADREFYDILQQGRGAHEEPLMWIISTQAPTDDALLSQEIDYALRVQRGEIDDPTVKLFLFTTPEDMDISDPEAWRLSNPAMGDFLNIADLEEAARSAEAMPSAEATFRNLRLNQRVSALAHFITPSLWKACGEEFDMSVFEECLVTAGLDLSGKNDLTAMVFVAQDMEGVWHVLPLFWTPADGLEEREKRDKVPYTTWRDQGFLEAVPGRTIDYRYVAKALGEFSGRILLKAVKFDRWRIDDFQRALQDEGVDAWVLGKDWSEDSKAQKPDGIMLVPHGQGYRDMNPAVEVVEDVLLNAKLRHGNHPVLTMCASNARVQKDPAGNRKFDKLKSTGRIDGLVALAMALNGAQAATIKPSVSVYANKEMLVL